MKRLALLLIIVCLGLLVGSAAVIGGPAGPPGGIDVNVVSPDPLPVTGEISATVTGDVNVSNTPLPVTISNQEIPVPFQHNLEDGNFDVPEGMTAEVDFVYWWCNYEGDVEVHYIGVVTSVDGKDFSYIFPASQVSGYDAYMFSSPVKIFADGNTSISLTRAVEGSGPSSFECRTFISGHLSPMSD